MIPRAHIIEWQKNAPWKTNAQVEQDLMICRAIVEIFSDQFLANTKALIRPTENYNQTEAYELVKTELIERI